MKHVNSCDFSDKAKYVVRAVILLVAMLALVNILPGTAQGNSSSRPPSQRQLTGELDELRQIAHAKGTVSVIIELNVSFIPAGYLPDQAAVQAQEQKIHRAQATIGRFLAPFNARPLATDWSIPFVAYEVNVNALNGLVNSPLVKNIELNRELDRQLTESTVIIDAPVAWNAGYDGSGIAVAIIDDGIDADHAFFGGRVVDEACFLTAQTGKCPDGSSTMIGTGAAEHAVNSEHGTHVAGIAAGEGASFDGVARNADIIAINVFDHIGGAPSSDVIDALNHVYTLRNSHTIAAVNMSLGGGRYFGECDVSEASYAAAINQLYSVNIATVVASGNNGYKDSIGSPACVTNAISVGSTDDGSGGTTLDAVSSFSNNASFLDILAPGDLIESSVPGGGFDGWQGTSMATPHVAGAFVLLRQQFPTQSVAQLLSSLLNSGVPVTDSGNGITKPRLNLDLQAIQCLAFPRTVTSEAELKNALICANANSSADTILMVNAITLTEALPTVASVITIEGNGHTLSRVPGASQIRLLNNSGGNLTVNNLTLTNGNSGGGHGGSISNGFGTLHLNAVVVDSNSAQFGGGLYAGPGSVTTIVNSTFTNNTAVKYGGAILNDGGTITISNTSLSGNNAVEYGGGIDNDSGGTVTISNSTISGNHSPIGGGIDNYSGTATLINSTVANNTDSNLSINTTLLITNTIIANGGTAGDCEYVSGSVSGTNNLDSDGSCAAISGSGTTQTASLNLDANLADNGGSTLTYALLSGSSAIDAGDPSACADVATVNNLDQRAYLRPIDGDGDSTAICDIGAFEFDSFGLPPENTNLMYNPSFNAGVNGDAGWLFSGTIQHVVNGGVINLSFPVAVNGWMRQFRAVYPLQAGLRMVAWVNVSNPDPSPKSFQFILRDSDLSNTLMCSFTVPASAPARNYFMRFIPGTTWEIIRADLRPTVVDSNGLNFDNVNLRYRPWLTFTDKECIAPNFGDEVPVPPDSELVANEIVVTPNGVSENQSADVPTICKTLDWFNTANWNGYLPTSELQFVFDPFPQMLLVGNGLAHSDDETSTVEASLNPTGGTIFDANGDGVADTLYDALSYDGHVNAVPLQNPPSVYGGNEGGNASATLIREAVIAMLNDRYDSNHPESWWAVEIDTAEALASGENAMLQLAQQYALSNSTC